MSKKASRSFPTSKFYLLVYLCSIALMLVLMPLKSAANIDKSSHGNKQKYAYSKSIIVIVDDFSQAIKIFRWLDQVYLTDIGRETINAINQSEHHLTIFDSETALISAGLTSAPMSNNLINGKGEDVEIKFYLDMEKEGTNCVLGESGKYIQYTAIQNLFHELVHARHKMNGTWLYFASEKQAIVEENQFRIDWASYRSLAKAEQRAEYAELEEVVTLSKGKCQIEKLTNY